MSQPTFATQLWGSVFARLQSVSQLLVPLGMPNTTLIRPGWSEVVVLTANFLGRQFVVYTEDGRVLHDSSSCGQRYHHCAPEGQPQRLVVVSQSYVRVEHEVAVTNASTPMDAIRIPYLLRDVQDSITEAVWPSMIDADMQLQIPTGGSAIAIMPERVDDEHGAILGGRLAAAAFLTAGPVACPAGAVTTFGPSGASYTGPFALDFTLAAAGSAVINYVEVRIRSRAADPNTFAFTFVLMFRSDIGHKFHMEFGGGVNLGRVEFTPKILAIAIDDFRLWGLDTANDNARVDVGSLLTTVPLL